MPNKPAGQVRVGVSGWRYPPWRGHFYPDNLRQADELAYLSRAFPVSEINGSFYSLQTPKSYAAWAAATPPGFVFTVKAPRYITHILRLKDAQPAIANFLASGLFELGDKLGPILWQFPPSLAFDAGRFSDFLSRLPHSTAEAAKIARGREARMKGRESLRPDADRPLRHAVEVRHMSFLDPAFLALLRQHRVAAVMSDTPNPWPRFEEATTGFTYLRLHGTTELYQSRYTPAALRQWATRLDKLARTAGDVFCFFDNTDKLHAPDNAGQMLQLMGVAPRYEGGLPVSW